MKKFLKLLVAIILAIVILGGVMFLVDCSKGKSGKEPMFAVATNYDNGGGTYYQGLGYSIYFNFINGGISADVGPWYIELQKSNNDIIMPDINNNKENESSSGDAIIDDNQSGEISISGDNINVENVSGETISGDNEISGNASNNVSGEQIDTETFISGDNFLDSEIVSGDDETEKESEFIFEAVVIGVNNNNLIVQALQDEVVNASADMFSFSLNEENNVRSTEFLIGQKVKIEYTGTIAESYPAQIKVVRIEVIE